MRSMVVMGRVVAPYGVLGWLKIVPDTAEIDGLLDYATWWLGRDEAWREMRVETAKIHNDVLLVKLAGVDDRNVALTHKGQQVAVPRAQLPASGVDEYYWTDLIGLRVKNQQQVDLGVIVEVFATGANDVLVLQPDATKSAHKPVPERLLPFIASVVLDVNLQEKTMQVDWDENF